MLDKIDHEITLAIRSRYPIIYLVSWEEERVARLLEKIAKKMDKQLIRWSSTQGFREAGERGDGEIDPQGALRRVMNSPDKALFVLHDFHAHVGEQNFNPEKHYIIRLLRDVSHALARSYKTLIIVAPKLEIPVALEKDISVIDIPLPTEKELREVLDKILKSVENNPKVKLKISDDLKNQVVLAAKGLTEREAERVFAKAIVNNLTFDEEDLKLIIEEKRQIIRKTELLEYYHLQEDLANVGGIGNLKRWLRERKNAFTDKAKSYGLPDPRGILLLGVQGCGKSLTAKAVASLWKLPLLRLDVGNIFGSFMGQSESNMRRATKIAESLAPCVLWLDEIEKGFSGLSDGAADGGTSKRVLGSFLVWMQEKRETVIIIATANSIHLLPPELLRKGRFDEIFFVDLPVAEEREEIFKIHLAKRNRDPQKYDLLQLAKVSNGYSGAEIEQGIIGAMFRAFSEDREITTKDIETEIKSSVPLSSTMAEDINAIRNWAKTRARLAR